MLFSEHKEPGNIGSFVRIVQGFLPASGCLNNSINARLHLGEWGHNYIRVLLEEVLEEIVPNHNKMKLAPKKLVIYPDLGLCIKI